MSNTRLIGWDGSMTLSALCPIPDRQRRQHDLVHPLSNTRLIETAAWPSLTLSTLCLIPGWSVETAAWPCPPYFQYQADRDGSMTLTDLVHLMSNTRLISRDGSMTPTDPVHPVSNTRQTETAAWPCPPYVQYQADRDGSMTLTDPVHLLSNTTLIEMAARPCPPYV